MGKEKGKRGVFYASIIVNVFSEMELKEFSCGFVNKLERNIQDIHKYDNFRKKAKSDSVFFILRKVVG